jgi:hypothetical protein
MFGALKMLVEMALDEAVERLAASRAAKRGQVMVLVGLRDLAERTPPGGLGSSPSKPGEAAEEPGPVMRAVMERAVFENDDDGDGEVLRRAYGSRS